MLRGAGVAPAIFLIPTRSENAGETPAPQEPAQFADSVTYVPPIRNVLRNEIYVSSPGFSGSSSIGRFAIALNSRRIVSAENPARSRLR
jgi:hypothetical protein